MKAKKRVSLLLALCLMLSLASVGVQAAPEYDLGGVTVTTLLFGGLIDLFESPEMLDRRADVEKQFNVKIVYEEVPWDGYQEAVMRRVLSGDSEWDFYRVRINELHELVWQDALLPLDPHMPDYVKNKIPEFSQQFMNLTYSGDSRFGFLGGALDLIDMIKYIGYNKDMFEAEGLPDPYELYRAGEWTWEAFTDIALVLTADTTGDDTIDRWAIDMIYDEDLVLSNDGRYVREIDGRYVFTGDELAVVEALVQNDEWRSQGFFRGWGPEAFRDQSIGMMFLEMWRLREHTNPNTGTWGIDFNLGIVPFPKGPSTERNIYPTGNAMFYSLPSNSANPEAMIALIDALYPAEELLIEAEEAFMEWAPSKEAFGVLLESVVEWDGSLETFGKLIGPYERGDQTWGAYMASVKQQKQALLDDLLGQ